MKKIIFILIVLAGALNFQSCGLDNYDKPNATLQGTLVDSQTNEAVQSQYQNGAKIRLYEYYDGKWSPQPNDFFVRQDGTFYNQAVFAGRYKIAAEGPFENVDEIEMEFSGTKELQIKVVPFLRIEAGTTVSNTSVTITAKVGRTSSLRKINTLEFYCGVTPYVDKNTFEVKKGVSLENLEDSEIISTVFTETIHDLERGKTYYIRVGALAQNASNHFNYSKITEIKIP